VLNFSTTHDNIDHLLVAPVLDLSLSHVDFLDVPYDKDALCDNASVVHALKPHTCAEIKHAIHISNTTDGLELTSSLHTFGYIEFGVLCNLDCLEDIISKYVNLPWFSKHTFHDIGKYNNDEHFVIHRVYICDNLNYPFVVCNFDPLEGSHAYRN
jgi:hypothetical protein